MSVMIEPHVTAEALDRWLHDMQPATSAPKDMWHWPPPEKIDINALVAKEATRLDRLFPGWEDRVNISTLDIENGKNCILGQAAYKKVLFGRSRIGYVKADDIVMDDENAGGGEVFDEAYCSNSTRDAWVTEIKRRHA